MRWRSPFSKRLTDRLPYAVGAAAFCALLLSLAAVAIWQERQRQQERALLTTTNLARVLEARVADVFSRVDLMLQVARHDASRRLQSGAINRAEGERELQTFHQALPELQALYVCDAQGRVRLASGLGDAALGSLADPANFEQAGRRSSADPMTVIGPWRATEDGPWLLLLSRPVRNTDGQFLGVVTAELPVMAFEPVFRDLDLGRQGAATLRNDDLALVFRQPWPPEGSSAVGSVIVSEALRAAFRQDPASGAYSTRVAVDGVERLNVYRRVQGLPLTLLVGIALNDLPVGWSRIDLAVLLLAVGTMLVAIYAAMQLYRTSRRQIDAAFRRYQDIVESSHDAIITKTLDGVVTSWNPGSEEIFGYSAAEMIGRPMRLLSPPEHLDEETRILERLQRGETVEHFETTRLHRSGRRIAVSVTISPVLGPDGGIAGASMIARDITRQKAMEEEVHSLAFLDPLTRLPNRRMLLDRLGHAQVASRRQGHWAAVVFIDLDHFKQVNDQHGHETGDRLLIEVAQRLRSAVREADTVARLAGDEFVVLCENLGPDSVQAQARIEAVREKICQILQQDCVIGAARLACGASIGVRLFLGADEDIESLIHEADLAMYQDKGRRRQLAATAGDVLHRPA